MVLFITCGAAASGRGAPETERDVAAEGARDHLAAQLRLGHRPVVGHDRRRLPEGDVGALPGVRCGLL